MTLLGIERRRTRAAARRMAALGLVSGLSLAADRAAEAGIVYSGPQSIEVNSVNQSYGLDLNGDSNTDFTIAWASSGFMGDITSETPGAGAGNSVIIDGLFAAALGAGDLIDGAATFGAGQQTLGTSDGKDPAVTTGNFPNAPGDTYLGLKFDIGGQTHFGWALIDDVVTVNGHQSLTIEGWAYESSAGMGIKAGATSSPAVPEPASLLQLALGAAGAAGLTASRRRRATTVEAD